MSWLQIRFTTWTKILSVTCSWIMTRTRNCSKLLCSCLTKYLSCISSYDPASVVFLSRIIDSGVAQDNNTSLAFSRTLSVSSCFCWTKIVKRWTDPFYIYSSVRWDGTEFLFNIMFNIPTSIWLNFASFTFLSDWHIWRMTEAAVSAW